MAGLSPRTPLAIDENDGAYGLTKSYVEMIKQNLMNLILTIPGERIMDPLFGVGIYSYLFENMGVEIGQRVKSEISAKITKQVNTYLPFVDIIDVSFGTTEEIDNSVLAVSIEYQIVPLNFVTSINIKVGGK